MRRVVLTMLLACMSGEAAAAEEAKELPPCPGAYNRATWTNCTGDVTLASGHTYIGGFQDGKYSGQGTFTAPDGQIYVGEYKDGTPNGHGTHRFRTGEKYIGAFRDGRYNGHGTFTFGDRRKYVGDYKDGRPHGHGMEYRADGAVQRSGVWENGVFLPAGLHTP